MMDDQNIKSAVLAANDAFYRAFASADMALMTRVWGKTGAIAVEHPGAPRIIGRDHVLDSWRMILSAPPAITSTVEDLILDEDQWAVICQEDLGRAIIRMVNVFRQEGDAWKMIYHGPAPERRLSS